MKKNYLILILVLTGLRVAGQDIHFSQFYELPLLRNPAIAGIFDGDIRITAAYRNQWQSVTTPYQTQALGVEYKFGISANSDDFLTIGLQITNDEAGDSKLSKTQVFPVLNFHKSVGEEGFLSAGIMAGAVQHRFDPTKLQFDDQYVNGSFSPTNPTRQTFDHTNFTYYDVAAGLSYSNTFGYDIRYYFGLGLFHFTRPKVAFTASNDIKLNEKWTANFGISAPTSDDDRLILYGDYFLQGGHKQIQGGFMYSHDMVRYDDDAISIAAGFFYRWDDAVIPVIRFDYYRLGIGLCYDVNVSKLAVASQMRGGLEVTLSYKSFLNAMNSTLNKVKCPTF